MAKNLVVAEGSSPSTLRDYLHVLRRRKWLVLQALVIVPLTAVGLSLQQEKLYEANAEVLISRQNLAATLTGTTDPTAYQQADRIIETQANLARVRPLAARVVAATGFDGTAQDFLDRSSVSARQNADLLVFKASDHIPENAERYASVYAQQFKLYRRQLDTAAFVRARTEVSRRLKELAEAGQQASPLYASLSDKEQELRTLEALQTSNAFVVQNADSATQIQPRLVRNGILGLALGLVLGLGLAFLFEALDVRVRSSEDVEERLGLPLLGRLPAPPRGVRKRNQLVTVHDPHGAQAEGFRRLRLNVEFMSERKDAGVILVTSALEQEGKSTTAANLAVSLARTGRSVALVDLDLRRPFLHKFVDTGDRPGLTHVILGRATLDEALAPVAVALDESPQPAPTNGSGPNGQNDATILHVLKSGPLPPSPGEFAARATVAALIDELRERFDYVIIDSPPVLQVGDAIVLGRHVDSVLLVTRLKSLRRYHLRELRRVLGNTPAKPIGFVVTGAEKDSGYGYGRYEEYGYTQRAPAEEPEDVPA